MNRYRLQSYSFFMGGGLTLPCSVGFTYLFLFVFRPLATSLDDKVSLQDCLELGRTAKVGALSLLTDENLKCLS